MKFMIKVRPSLRMPDPAVVDNGSLAHIAVMAGKHRLELNSLRSEGKQRDLGKVWL